MAGVSDRFRAANMEVPDWGTAPEEDYPLLLAPNSLPASDNARKKAKRKQKQQQEHLQNLIHAPVQLLSTTVPSGQAKKHYAHQDPHLSQAKKTDTEQQSRSDVTTSIASQHVVGQAAKGKKRARSISSMPEVGVDDDNILSQQGTAQLLSSTQEAKQRGSKAAAISEAHAASKSILRGQQFPKADQKLGITFITGTKQQTAAQSGAQPKVKKAKKARLTSSNLVSTDPLQSNIQHPLVPAREQATSITATGGISSDATVVKGKQKKLGRNARLRLKRQAFRQQAHSTTGMGCLGKRAAEVAAAQPAAGASKKAKTAREESLSATGHSELPSAQGRAAQATPGNGKQTPVLPAKLDGRAVKQGRQGVAPAAASAPPAEKVDSLPAGKPQKKKGLLEQMRSKLSGGRFRMLNEQLYTSAGQHAFQMMQGQPDLYQQYHEGFREQTQHWPVQPVDMAIAWLKKKSPAWVAADFGCGDAELGRSVPQTVHSLDLVATAPGVTACNMAHTPLESASIDAVIFCLALMGTDYGSFIKEAFRVLRPGGLLWIAEVRSRFVRSSVGSDAFSKFVDALKQQGLTVIQQDSSNKMFVVFEAKKVAKRCDAALEWPELKPCLYKRR